MSKRIYVMIIASLLPFSCLGAETTGFYRNLSVGSKGEDVRALQKILNSDVDTRVSLAGAGSPGNESDYFGPATRAAVVKFQEKYRTEILLPVGLISGTGIFGSKSRDKANVIAVNRGKGVVATSTSSLVDNNKIVNTSGQVMVMMPSQYSGKPGTMITISGSGFTSTNNTIYFGPDHAVIKASSWNGQSITFQIPQIPKGIYTLYVKNTQGESNKDQWFVVTDGISPAPQIDSFDPGVATRGAVVTLRGSGFLSAGNTIMVDGVGVFKNSASSDGKSLTFTIPTNAFPVKFSSTVSTPQIPLSVYVVNENGVSNGMKIKLGL